MRSPLYAMNFRHPFPPEADTAECKCRARWQGGEEYPPDPPIREELRDWNAGMKKKWAVRDQLWMGALRN